MSRQTIKQNPPTADSPEIEKSSSHGQSRIPGTLTDPEYLQFDHISIAHGLSQSTVHCILQDRQGFMWFGTNDGLNRYDGYAFRVYRHDPLDEQSPGHNNIMSIHEDAEGILWIGTYGGGLDRFDPETKVWHHYQHNPDNPNSLSHNNVRFIYETADGTLWIATHGGGLNKFDLQTEQFTHYKPDLEEPFRLDDWHIDTVFEDKEGGLWIGSNNMGLVRFDRETGVFFHYQHNLEDPYTLSSNNLLTAITEDSTGKLWVASFDGLNYFDKSNGNVVRYSHNPEDSRSLGHNIVQTLYQDHSGRLWIGTGGGLDWFDPQTQSFFHYRHDPVDPFSLSSSLVMSIYEDRAGSLWVGTMGGGLNRIDNRKARFQQYINDPADTNSLSNNNVEAILEDSDGMLWIGTSGGGLNRYNQTTEQWRQYLFGADNPYSLGNNIVSAILEDDSGRLWIGTAFGGLGQFDRVSEQYIPYQSSNPDHNLMRIIIRALYQDHKGLLWIGTHGNGIYVIDPETDQVTNYRHNPDDPFSVSDDWIYTFYEDSQQVMWIGTRDKGLDRFDGQTKQFTHIQHDPQNPDSLSGRTIHTIYQDHSGMLWVGTDGGGLNKLENGVNNMTHYGVQDGLPSNSVFGILEDNNGYLWLSTASGLSRFDPDGETFRNYDARDGLQNSVFVGGAAFKSNRGEMIFGGFNGITGFYPAQFQDNSFIPPIVLTALTQNGRDIDMEVSPEYIKKLILRRPYGFFEFEYASLNYTQSAKNQFAYKLVGYDTDWTDAGTKRFGNYGNLPAGEYVLRIKGSNNDGVWNETGLSIQITVVPQFWETPWFWGMALFFCVGVVVGVYRLRTKAIQARNNQLESLVEERTAQLEALYLADEKMHSHLRLDHVLQTLVDLAVDILHADKSAVFVLDNESDKWEMRVARGFSLEAIHNIAFPGKEINLKPDVDQIKVVVVEDSITGTNCETAQSDFIQIMRAEGIQEFINLPIRVNTENYIFNVSFNRTHLHDQDEERLFLSMAQRASLAIENARLYEQAQELAVLEERQRLARDLHDAVTQTLFSTSLIAEVLPRIWEQDPVDGYRRLEQVRQGARSALAEMRALLLELRPAGLVDTDLGDLLHQLSEAVKGWSNVSVTVSTQDGFDLPSSIHIALYRIAQEALNNVAKHAHTERAWVSLKYLLSEKEEGNQEKIVTLSIGDNGCGFDPDEVAPDHLGLRIMRERAENAGILLTVHSTPGQGTQIIASWTADKEKTYV